MPSDLLSFDTKRPGLAAVRAHARQDRARTGIRQLGSSKANAALKPAKSLRAWAALLGLAAAGVAYAQAPATPASAASASPGPSLASSPIYAPGVGPQSREWMAQCAGQLPATRVSVSVTPSRIFYNSPSARELTSYFKLAPGSVTLGRTTAQPRIASRVGGKALSSVRPEQAGCYRPQMDITLSFDPQRVSIAQEIPNGSCGYQHVLKHELEHVRINQDGLKAMAGLLKQVLVQRYGNQVFFGEPSYWQAQLRKDIESWRPWLEKELEQKLRAQHQALDSPQEYAKNRTVCNGELARVIDRVVGG